MTRGGVSIQAGYVEYHLIVLDVDGTLLDSSHQLRPRVAQAIQHAQNAGLHIALATGKLLGSVVPLLRRMGISGPQIVLNGAATLESETGQPVRYVPLREDDRKAVISTVRAADPHVLVSHFTLDGILMDGPHPAIGIFEEYGEAPPRLVPDLMADGLPPAAKILLSGEPERLASIRAVVTPALGHRVTITTTTPDFLEFFDPSANKGLALAALRESMGLARENVVVMGDGENDLPLFGEAGLAIAMGNASPVLKAAAHRIALTNDEDGVAVVLEELLAGLSTPKGSR
jgi:Cof subfamily protein (haloacid dehalogenase superfamily)